MELKDRKIIQEIRSPGFAEVRKLEPIGCYYTSEGEWHAFDKEGRTWTITEDEALLLREI